MTEQASSQNFGFLLDYDPLLVEYAQKAELYAFTDPNTSLVKTRQFGECLAKSAAAHAGMDCTQTNFDDTIRLLKRQKIIQNDTYWQFDHVLDYGNEAVHDHKRERTAALKSLICAHELANWFQICVLNKSDFEPTPFRPPPKPQDATNELKEEIDFLREEVARSNLESDASESQIKEQSQKLEKQAITYEKTLRSLEAERDTYEKDLSRLERESTQRLTEVTPVATNTKFQSILERGNQSRMRLGHTSKNSLPLTQLRITTGEPSRCCGAPMVIVQASSGGFCTKNCVSCNSQKQSGENLGRREFENLQVYVMCNDCGQQAKPKIVGSNYGYRCECGWECELAQLIPHYTDNHSNK